MPGARWFPGARLNYAEHALALPGRAGSDVVVVAHSQTRGPVELTADELRDAVARCRAGLQRLGVRRGRPGRGLPAQHPRDARRVPRDRLARRDLVLLRAGVRDAGRGRPVRADRARRAADDRRLPLRRPRARPRGRGGRDPRRAADASGRRSSSPTCATEPAAGAAIPGAVAWSSLLAEPAPLRVRARALRPPAVRPLLVRHHRAAEADRPRPRRHPARAPEDARPAHGPRARRPLLLVHDDRLDDVELPRLGARGRARRSSCSTANPAWPDLGTLWRLASEARVTYLGLSAPFLMACRAAGLVPGHDPALDLAALRGVGSTGAPLPADGFHWVRDAVSAAIPVGSLSGGTDVCTGFVGPSPLVPVWAGEISCRMLGAKVEAFDEAGHPVDRAPGRARHHRADAVDAGRLLGRRRRVAAASRVLRRLPGCLAARRLDHDHRPRLVRHHRPLRRDPQPRRRAPRDGGVLRGGRGTAGDRRLARRPPRGRGRRAGRAAAVRRAPGRCAARRRAPCAAIAARAPRPRCRRATCPTRSTPCPAIPRTLSGKKLEVPVKRILLGMDPDLAASKDALADPGSLARSRLSPGCDLVGQSADTPSARSGSTSALMGAMCSYSSSSVTPSPADTPR